MTDIPESELRERLARSHVAILGCGGLGSNVALMLVRSGVGALRLVDFDVVEAGNLNRQMYFADQIGEPKVEALAGSLRRIRQDVELELVRDRITSENLVAFAGGVEVIVEAVDSAQTKALIINVCTRDLPEIPLVAASGLAGCGVVNLISTEQLAQRVWVCGDQATDVRDDSVLLASRVMVAAAHQAHAVTRLLLGLEPA